MSLEIPHIGFHFQAVEKKRTLRLVFPEVELQCLASDHLVARVADELEEGLVGIQEFAGRTYGYCLGSRSPISPGRAQQLGWQKGEIQD